MMRSPTRVAAQAAASLLALLAAGCMSSGSSAGDGDSPAATPSPANGTPSAAGVSASDAAAGWRPLFDGRSLAGWRAYQGNSVPDGWRVEDGMIVRRGEGGDIITREKFRNFELALEWRVEPGGNSGIMYRVTEASERPYHTGPEMQVLDDARHRDGQNPLTSAGALYGLYPAPKGAVKPAGEWNQARLLVNGNHVEHWLNGVKTAEAEIGSADWNERVAKSKFNEWPGYAKSPEGHIAIQDHGDVVWFRNIRIRVLP
jgi:hypothetical protein